MSARISVIMPCFNEERFISNAILSLVNDYSLKNCEFLIIDGMSQDGTRDRIYSLIEKGIPIRMLENKKRFQVHGLNLGLSEARGEIIIRADAHCLYPSGYIKHCVELLESKGAANVGGVMHPRGYSQTQSAIALAMQHPVGVGDARFHLGNFSGYVDTVYLGTFWRKIFNEIGLYDTNCLTNEDAELNLRIRTAGKKIFLDSSIKVTYFPRESLRDLARQYFHYGKGRCYTTLKHKKITSWRQMAPVVFVLTLLISVISGLFIPVFWLIPFLYFGALLLVALLSWPKKKIPIKIGLLMGLAFAVMHLSWGIGFLCMLIATRPKSRRIFQIS